MDDLSEIIGRAQGGDTLAFNSLVRRFSGFAHERAVAWLGDHHRAEEVVQEAFLEAALKLHQLQSPHAFTSWFKRILLKHCDRVTRRKAVPLSPLTEALDLPDRAPGASDIVLSDQRRTLVYTALTVLTADQRELIYAVYWDDEPQKELSARLGLPLTTVKKRLYTARQRLAEFLQRAGDLASPVADAPVFPQDVQLFMAAWHGHVHRVCEILDEDPERLHLANEEGMSLLLFAAHAAHYSGNRQVADLLLARGAVPGRFERAALGLEPDARTGVAVDRTGPWNRTALHWAACGGHVDRVRALLLEGADPDRPDQWGCTALHLAADFGHGAVFALLLSASACPHRTMNNGKSVMHLAAQHGDRSLLRIGARAGLAIDLFAAASSGDLGLASRLLQRDRAQINARLKIGASPLSIAAERGHTEMVEWLVKQGARLDPVSAIALDEDDALFEMLARQPKTVDRRAGSFGFTPLHAASVRGRDSLVRLLLHQGAQVNRPDRMFRKTPMHEALFFGRESAARLLHVHGGQLQAAKRT